MEGKMKVRIYKVLFFYNIIIRWIFMYLFFLIELRFLQGWVEKNSFIFFNSYDRGNYKDFVFINIYDRVEVFKKQCGKLSRVDL